MLLSHTNLIDDYSYSIELVLESRGINPQRTRAPLADCAPSLRSKVDYANEHLHLSQINSFSVIQCETDLSTDVFVKFLQHLSRLHTLPLSMSLLKRLLI